MEPFSNSATFPEPPDEPTDETFLAPHFFPPLCQACKSRNITKLKKCSSCKLVRYCSPACQKEHWPLHKELCRAFKKLPDPVRNIEMFEKNRVMCKITLLEEELKRPLYVDELEMLQFQEHCNHCSSLKTTDSAFCDNCCAVSYCNDNHKTLDQSHTKWCFKLALARLCYVYGFKWKANITSLSGIPVNGNMITFLQDAGLFPEAAASLKEERILAEEEGDLVQLVNLSERLSYPLSFASAIQTSCQNYKENMTVHVVGAEAYIETLNLKVWSVVMEQLRLLTKHMTLRLVGASLLFGENYRIVSNDSSITFEIIPSLYETFCQSESYSLPDAVVCYNCGIHEKGPWVPALQYLVPESGVPLIISSYTLEECAKDVATINEAYDGKLKVQGPRLNPFASLRPYRNWYGLPDTPENGLVFFHNAAIAVLEL